MTLPNNIKRNAPQTQADEVEVKKFLDINGLSRFMDLIKNWAAPKEHTHSMADINGDGGALPIGSGGTGANSAKAAQYNLLNDAAQISSEEGVIDSTNMAFFTSGASTTNGAIQKMPVSTFWNYIVSKIRSAFGFNSSNVLSATNGGTGASNIVDAVKALGAYSLNAGSGISSNTDLNNMKTTGNYICDRDTTAATISNCPTGGKAFALKVGDLLGDTKYPYQEVVRYTDGASWRRVFNMTSSTWNAWESTSTARFGTTLWTGTWSAGSITVNGINNYDMYIMKTSGQNDNLMLGVRDGNVIHCHSVYSSTTNLMTLNTITIGITGDTLVRTMPRTWTLEGTAIKTANGSLVINTIKGVL